MTDNYKVYESDLDEFVQDPNNANLGSPRGDAMIEMSLREHKAGRSLLADSNGVLIGGNKTQKQAKQVGLKKVIVVESDGDALIVHKRRDLDLSKDPKARELAYLDNRAGEVSLTWDMDQISADIEAGLDLSIMFYDDELDLQDEDEGPDEESADRYPEMELQPFEHYDYVMLVFRDHFDWSQAMDLFGLERQEMTLLKAKRPSKKHGQRKTRKIGLVRVIDGRKVLQLCKSSSPAESE